MCLPIPGGRKIVFVFVCWIVLYGIATIYVTTVNGWDIYHISLTLAIKIYIYDLSPVVCAKKLKLKVVTNEKGEASGAVLTIRY
jgi:hypothetical protein